MPNNTNGWCTTSFTKAQLDGKAVFFTMPTNNEYYLGHFHVLAVNAAGQMQIEIDYGRPLPGGTFDVGTKIIDQPWMDHTEMNANPAIPADFIIRPLTGV